MIVKELIKTMAEDFRESLWDIFIDDLEIEEVEEPKNGYDLLKEEVHDWYIEPPYTNGKFFVMKMCIYTKKYHKDTWDEDTETVKEFLRRTKDSHDGFKAIVYDPDENECLSFTISKESYLEFEKTVSEKILERIVSSEHFDFCEHVIHIYSKEEE